MAMCVGDPKLFDLTNNSTMRLLASLEKFNETYTVLHRYMCAFFCFFGILLNLLHIVVLSRLSMRGNAINNVLSVIAVCDVLTMISYFIYIIRFKITIKDEEVLGYSYGWLVFLMVHVVASIALHTVTLYLCVFMAFVRWISLDRLNSKWIKSHSLGRIFGCTFFTVALLSIPTLMVHKIVNLRDVIGNGNVTQQEAVYTVTLDRIALQNGCKIFKMNLWLTGVCFKVIPCVLLACFTVALQRKLSETSQKRRLLLQRDQVEVNSVLRKKSSNVDKTTIMLIIMLTVFLLTELPQGALAILNAIFTTDVHVFVYINLGELLDFLSLVNCFVGFFLYGVMSSRYRATFRIVFLDKLSNAFSKQTKNTNDNNNSTMKNGYMKSRL